MHGGRLLGASLAKHGVTALFTLCGGHISPILVGAKEHGLRVVDVRDEASAVFAADAYARVTGNVGVAAVTAGPGVTNTVTAVKNAQMAESPVVVFGGATATILRGRGSLQDIDQISVLAPITKWATRVTTVPSLVPTLERAISLAKDGVPGPVFVEVPIDLLYPEATVREWYAKETGSMSGLTGDAVRLYLRAHLLRQFHAPHLPVELPRPSPPRVRREARLARAVAALERAERPVIVVGSQALVNVSNPAKLAGALETLGVPTFLGGSARGLLGRSSTIQYRHERGKALREADVVVVLGFPFDFRLKYGQAISRRATVIAANLDRVALHKNRSPDLAFEMHPAALLEALASALPALPRRGPWIASLDERERARDREIGEKADAAARPIDPVHFFLRLEEHLGDDAVLVADGGDFVATGSYVLRPRAPLSWLDPGAFGTLGVGGGFALGAYAARPSSQVWILYGDGSSAYSLAELDTCVRHGFSPIAIVGNDASWAQIARDQVDVLGDDVGTTLLRTSYEEVGRGYGAAGLAIEDPGDIDRVLGEARAIAGGGRPVVVNVHLRKSDFRKGSISV